MKFFLTVILILFFTNSFAQEKKLTVGQSVGLALQNSDDLKILESKIVSSKSKITEAKSQFFPQLQLSAGYTRLSAVDPYLIIIPFSTEPVQLSEVFTNNYNIQLSLRQPIYTGNRILSQKKSAELMEKSVELDFSNEKNNVAFNAQISFWNYYKTLQIKKVALETVTQTEKHITDTKNFLINGLATTSDLLKFEVQNSNAKLQLLEAENNIELARVSFNKIIGIPMETKSEPEVQEFTEPETGELNLRALISEAFEKRIELKSLEYKIKSANENIKTARSSYFPSIYLGGNAYYSNPNLRYQPPEDVFKSSWDASLIVSWNIWNWGLTSSQVTQAEQVVNQNRTGLRQMKDAVELEVNQNFLNLNYQKEKIEVTKIAIKQAEENLRIINEKFDVQLATSTEVVDAETALFQAKTNFTNAMIDYKTALLKLYKSVGRKLY